MPNIALPSPPLEFISARLPQHVFTIVGLLIIGAVLLIALKHWNKTRTPFLLMILLGGVFTVIWEPIMDVQLFVYHGEHAAGMIAFEVMGRSIPWWVVVVWTGFCGGITVLLVLLMIRPGGMTPQLFWLLVAGSAVANLAIEIPMINAGTYIYYGPYQAFQFFGFPFWWVNQNMLGPLIGSAILYRGRNWFTGKKVVLAAVVPVMAYGAGYSAANFPILAAMNSAASPTVLHICAAVTFCLAGLIIYGVSQVVCRSTTAHVTTST